jgi:NAD(P)-dependent dehydrogenase (short-subunit alcohol dehydrogenase family)
VKHAKALYAYGAAVILADINLAQCEAAVEKLKEEDIHVFAKHCDVDKISKAGKRFAAGVTAV